MKLKKVTSVASLRSTPTLFLGTPRPVHVLRVGSPVPGHAAAASSIPRAPFPTTASRYRLASPWRPTRVPVRHGPTGPTIVHPHRYHGPPVRLSDRYRSPDVQLPPGNPE